MAISDDPQAIAILTNPHNIDIYKNNESPHGEPVWSNLKQRSIIFGHEISTIALSPDAKILAAGYRGGVEIVSVAQDVADNQRRQISCEPMAEIAFSGDGRTLIATSTTRKTRPTTIISVGNGMDGPMSEEGIMEPLPPEQAWISQLLFPERATHARQAALLPEPMTGPINELFAYNAEDDSWGIFDLTMKRFSAKTFNVLDLLPSTRKMNFESALPAVSSDYGQVAIASKHTGRSDVLIYQIPFSWRGDDISPSHQKDGSKEEPLAPSYVVPLHKSMDTAPESINTLRWLGRERPSLPSKRLIALTVTSTHQVEEDLSAIPPAASGRIVLMDLAPAGRAPSTPRKVTINFDELPEERLGDDPMDFEREVSLLRSRTLVQRRRSSTNSTDPRFIGRASTSLGMHRRPDALLSPSDISETSLTRRHSLSSITSDDTETSFGALVLDEPYSQTQPRSQFSLQRAATISAQAGANRRHLLALPNRPLEYRRADGLRWIPHESDADNWIPPPPPYTREVDPAVSQHLSGSSPPPAARPTPNLNTSVPAVAATAAPTPLDLALAPELPPTRPPSTSTTTNSALPHAQQVQSLDLSHPQQVQSLDRRISSPLPPPPPLGVRRVHSADLHRPLPPLPQEGARSRGSRLAMMSILSTAPEPREDPRRFTTMTGLEETRRKRKSARCVVM